MYVSTQLIYNRLWEYRYVLYYTQHARIHICFRGVGVCVWEWGMGCPVIILNEHLAVMCNVILKIVLSG